MRNVFNCRVIAHRGASSYFPENTMIAFEKALEMKAHMIELDISFTKDKVPVVIHDDTVDRTTDGKGKVCDLSYAEIRRLDAGKWKNKKFKGEKISSLEEVLEMCSNVMPLNVEIKTESVSEILEGGIEETALNLVNKYNMNHNVIFSSFDPRALINIRKLNQNMPTACLYYKPVLGEKNPSEIINFLKCNSFNCSIKEINAEWLNNCRENKIGVNVYTVDNRWKMKKLFQAGVNGIFSNKPDLLLKIFEELPEL